MSRKPLKPARIGTIGLIGLGLMGLAIARRLIGAGQKLVGFDIAPRQSNVFSKLGGTPAHRAAEVFASCDRVILSLRELGVVASVIREVSSVLRPGQIIIDTTTGAPAEAVALSRKLAKRRVVYLDATISGSSAQLLRGEIVLMVGGPKRTVTACKDLFQLLGKQAIHTGPSGSGSKMKLVTNLVLGLNRAALAEGLVFGRALGLKGEQVLHALRATMAYSRIMDTKGEKMLRRDFKPQARLSQHLKDVQLMLAAAKRARLKLPLTQTHRKLLAQAEAAGLGQLDNSAIIQVISTRHSRK
jgi:3-hydroxyisobutyrate dehydrogenase-like beta-hydroxyacid dehydrogenase